MPDSQNLAARLLAFAPSAEVADALLTDTELADGPARMGHCPSPTAGTTAARRGVNYAATVAGAADDPQLLAVLGKLPQKTVRRLIAARPNTPLATLEALKKWALKEGDDETLNALAGTLPPLEYLPLLSLHRDSQDHSADLRHYGWRSDRALPVPEIVDNLARRGDVAEIWNVFALNLPALRRGIVAAAGTGRLPVSPARLIASRREDEQAGLLDALLENRDVVLDADSTDFIVARLRDDEELPVPYRQHARHGRTLTPEVMTRFVSSGVAELAESAARSLLADTAEADDALFDVLTRTEDEGAVGVLLRNAGTLERLTVAQIARLAKHVSDASAVGMALKHRGADLDDDVVVDLLRGGDAKVTCKWITGQLPTAPTAAQLAALAARPGKALIKSSHSGYDETTSGVTTIRRGQEPDTVPDLVDLFLGAVRIEHLANPGVVDVLDAGGRATLRYAATKQPPMHGNACTAYLGARCAETFGGFAPAWTTVAKLATTVEAGTVSEFLMLVAAMVDLPAAPAVEDPAEAEPEPAPAVPEPAAETAAPQMQDRTPAAVPAITGPAEQLTLL